MTISTFERNATIAEMAVEMDRRGAVIDRLEAEIARLTSPPGGVGLPGADVPQQAPYRRRTDMTKNIVGRLAGRFLTWKLPADFNPDGGVTFTPEYQNPSGPAKHEPTGTNLLTYAQAVTMVEHMLADLIESLSPPDGVGLTRYGQRVAEFDNAFWVEADKDPEGKWVRHDDATAALAAEQMAYQSVKNALHAAEKREAAYLARGDEWQAVAEKAGVCMACALGAHEPYGCTDCLNTGWAQGAPPGYVDEAALAAKEAEAKHWHECWMAEQDLRDKDRAERDARKAALAPFAEALDEDDFADERLLDRDEIWEHPVAMRITFKHLRDAKRAALSPAQGGE